MSTEPRAEVLPVGTVVQVTEHFGRITEEPRVYRAVIRGYDMSRTKYHLAPEFMRGEFTSEPICWAFLGEVSEEVLDDQ